MKPPNVFLFLHGWGLQAALNNSYSRGANIVCVLWVVLFETASQTESRSEQQDNNTIQPQKAFQGVFYVCVHNWPQSERKAHRSQKTAPLPMMRAAAIQHRQSRSPKRAHLRTFEPQGLQLTHITKKPFAEAKTCLCGASIVWRPFAKHLTDHTTA